MKNYAIMNIITFCDNKENLDYEYCGLDETATYTDTASGKTYSGSYLMNVGLYFEDKKGLHFWSSHISEKQVKYPQETMMTESV